MQSTPVAQKISTLNIHSAAISITVRDAEATTVAYSPMVR
jgi:hypothetical protein